MESDNPSVSLASASAPITAIVPVISPPPYSNDTASSLTPFKAQLVTLLNIPVNLVGLGDVSLRVAYRKYCTYLAAIKTYDRIVGEKSWTTQKPTKTDIIMIFVSKSFFHLHYCPLFGKVLEYPEMVAWLEDSEDSDDLQVWGVKKEVYVFKDLDLWLKNSGSLVQEEKKGKKEKKKRKKDLDEKDQGKKDKKKKAQKSGNK